VPDYKFTGDDPRIMIGLIQGVNALSSNNQTPYGSTVVCRPGGTLHTDEPYPHAELVQLEGEPQPIGSDGFLLLPPTDEPVTEDPASTDMTAEGAPAPATEQDPA
jgi:hypothetical protein